MTYRCMRCGNNILAQSDENLECQICGMTSGFIQVTEENKDTIPFPSNPYDYCTTDDGFDINFCNDTEGVCPCGVYIAHLIDKKCNVIETAVPKEPMRSDCYCKESVSPCGHSVSHKLIDPCTVQP